MSLITEPTCLRYYDDHAEPWECPRFCDFATEVDQKEEEDPTATGKRSFQSDSSLRKYADK
jgi:hypothetical protein